MQDRSNAVNESQQNSNNIPIAEFEGYSPIEMSLIFYETFEKDSPVQLKKLSDEQYKEIPLLNQIRFLATLIADKGELKLTQKGFLPVKIVVEVYNQGFLKDELIERGYYKVYKETDSMTVNLTRILLESSGIAKRRKGMLSLTKAGEKTLSDNHELLKRILKTFGFKFNWGYYDGYESQHIGQLGFGFSLVLLGKYGKRIRSATFYADKYFKAFPVLLENLPQQSHSNPRRYAASCYSLRTFNRFLHHFGLVKIDERKNWDEYDDVTKTELFDTLIFCQPHSLNTIKYKAPSQSRNNLAH